MFDLLSVENLLVHVSVDRISRQEKQQQREGMKREEEGVSRLQRKQAFRDAVHCNSLNQDK